MQHILFDSVHFNLLKVSIVILCLFLKDKHVTRQSTNICVTKLLVSVYSCFPQSSVSLVKFLFCFAWSLKQDGVHSPTAKENQLSENETREDETCDACRRNRARSAVAGQGTCKAPSLSMEAKCESLNRV